MKRACVWSVSHGIATGLVVIVLAGCASAPKYYGPAPDALNAATAQMDREGTPGPLRLLHLELLTSTETDYVQRAMRLGLAALRLGEYALAARTFDAAITRVEALQQGAKQAERAASKFVAEQEKWFKGEAYERAALYLYRGLLYAQAGDYGNAAACAKRASLMDLSTLEEEQADWLSAEWLLAHASLRGSDSATAQAALARAAALAPRLGVMAPPRGESGRLLLVESGQAPRKVRAGKNGERLTYLAGSNETVRVEVTHRINDKTSAATVSLSPIESLHRQASTRGERVVDSILAGKSSFKETTDIAGNVGLVGGAAVLLTSKSQEQTVAGAALIAAGAASKLVAAGTQAEADVRAWDNLPALLYLAELPPSSRQGGTLLVRGYNASGSVTEEREVVLDKEGRALISVRLP